MTSFLVAAIVCIEKNVIFEGQILFITYPFLHFIARSRQGQKTLKLALGIDRISNFANAAAFAHQWELAIASLQEIRSVGRPEGVSQGTDDVQLHPVATRVVSY